LLYIAYTMEEQAFCMRIEGFQIPKNVKRKWEQGKRDDSSARLTTLENLEIKLQAAEERRHVSIVREETTMASFCIWDSNRAEELQ
jgi:hypothetical protein